MAGCLTLTIIGGGAEIVGFGLAFYEMAVTQRREFPDYQPVHHRALAWVRRKLRLSKPQVIQVGAGDSIEVADSARVQVTRGPVPDDDLKARITRLEQIADDLHREHEADRRAQEQRMAKYEQRMNEADTAIRTELARLEAERKAGLRESITYEKAGITLFVVGVILSVLGNAVTC